MTMPRYVLKERAALKPSLVAAFFSLLTLHTPAIFGKEVSSPDQLGPFQFQSSLISSEVVGANLSEVGGFITGAELSDPIVAGIQLPGLLATDAKMSPDGPTVWVQVELRTVEPGFINVASIEVRSEVSYEIAVLGSVPEADIILAPRGKRSVLGNLTGSLLRASTLLQSDIKIYETDAFGNRAAIFHSWRPENPNSLVPGVSSGNFSDVHVPFDQRSDRITVATNQAYEILVTTAAVVQFRDISSFNLSAFAYIESSISTPTAGVELVQSSFDATDVTQESPPPRTTVSSSGEVTDATINAGTRLVGTSDYAESFSPGDTVEILATIEPESDDIGETAEVFLVIATANGLFQFANGAFVEFDGAEEGLQTLTELPLRAVTDFNLTDLLGGSLSFRDSDVGSYQLFFGYRTDQTAITFSEEPIVIEVQF